MTLSLPPESDENASALVPIQQGKVSLVPGSPAYGEVTTFEPSYNKDRFESTALTIDGKVGDIKLVYNGSYLVRNIEQQQDYTNYSRGVYGYYYQCTGLSKTKTTGTCYSPGATWQETERNTHLTQELRASTPAVPRNTTSSRQCRQNAAWLARGGSHSVAKLGSIRGRPRAICKIT